MPSSIPSLLYSLLMNFSSLPIKPLFLVHIYSSLKFKTVKKKEKKKKKNKKKKKKKKK